MSTSESKPKPKPKPKDRLYRCYWCGVWVCGTFKANSFRAWDFWACRSCFNEMVNE